MKKRWNSGITLKKEGKKLSFLIFLLILLITSSYAFFMLTMKGKSQYIMKSGNLKIKLDDMFSEGILLQNAVPTSDKDGLTTKAYTFTLENESTKGVKYKIYLDDIALEESKVRLPDKYIKYSLTKNEDTTTRLLNTTGENPNRILDNDTLDGKATNYYTLRIWMDKTADMSVMGNVFYAKIRAVAEQKKYNPTYTNENIKEAYMYDPKNCVTGEEETCKMIFSINKNTTIQPGTIIKYAVNNHKSKYFHVLHDDGETLTMQQRENTVYNTVWNSDNDNRRGPLVALEKLEESTADWDNVINQNYNMGTTRFGAANNGFSGCKEYNVCNYNHYTLQKNNVKARMITIQETAALNCTTSNKSCPNWMNNYLFYSTSSGGTQNDNYGTDGKSRNYGYWTMSTLVDGATSRAWTVRNYGLVVSSNVTTYTNSGARAVVVISK